MDRKDERIDIIESRYEDCILACYNCGVTVRLHQVAFRSPNNYVVGYTFLCDECHPHIADKKHGFVIVEIAHEEIGGLS